MGRTRQAERASVQWVCLDGAAVPYEADRKQGRSGPTADTAARKSIARQGPPPGAGERQPEPVQAKPGRRARRRVVKTIEETCTQADGPAGRLAFLAAFEGLRAALELRSDAGEGLVRDGAFGDAGSGSRPGAVRGVIGLGLTRSAR